MFCLKNKHVIKSSNFNFHQKITSSVQRILIALPCIIHVKLEKSKKGRSHSSHLGKEGDFTRNDFVTFLSSSNIQIVTEIFNMVLYYFLLMAYNSSYNTYTFHHCTRETLCCLSNAFTIIIENSIKLTLFHGKNDYGR